MRNLQNLIMSLVRRNQRKKKQIFLVTAMYVAMFVQPDSYAFPELIQDCMTVILLLMIPPFYVFPTHLARARSHDNTLAIAVLDLFLGWTLLGWVAALVWACTVGPRKKDA
jgi:Superinfection immunity protein